MNNVTQVLTKARDYLNQFGWRKDDYGNPSIGFCLTGAIRAAADVTDDRVVNLPPILRDVYATFTKPLQHRGRDPFRYTELLPRRKCSPEELELYREPYADEGEIIDYNDSLVHKYEALKLLDEALEESRKAA